MLMHWEPQSIGNADRIFCAMTYNDGTDDRYIISRSGKRFMMATIDAVNISFIPDTQDGVVFPVAIVPNISNPAAFTIASVAT